MQLQSATHNPIGAKTTMSWPPMAISRFRYPGLYVSLLVGLIMLRDVYAAPVWDFDVKLAGVPESNIDAVKQELTEVVFARDTNAVAKDVKIAAWAIKTTQDGLLPGIIEECIVLVHRSDAGKVENWVLSYVFCHSNPTREVPRRWEKLDELVDEGAATVQYDHRPTDNEIAGFVERTNFGNNEADPEMLVLVVAVYGKSPRLKEVLKKGITQEQKRSRHQRYLGRIMERDL